MSARANIIELCKLVTLKGAKIEPNGSISVLDSGDHGDAGIEGTTPDDIIIYYDYCTDDLSSDETDRLIEWLFDSSSGLRRFTQALANLGYNEFGDNDGSGGGLYYGCIAFRKV